MDKSAADILPVAPTVLALVGRVRWWSSYHCSHVIACNANVQISGCNKMSGSECCYASSLPSRGHFVPKPLVRGFECLELVLYGTRELA